MAAILDRWCVRRRVVWWCVAQIALFIWPGWVEHAAHGQEAQPARMDRPVVLISIRISDGGFEIQPFATGSWNDQGEVLDFLSDDAIQRELELTSDQIHRLQLVVERTRTAMAKLTDHLQFQGELPPGLSQALAAEGQSFRQELDALLLPHQQTAMEQLLRRLRVRRFGMIHELFEGALKEPLQVPRDQMTSYCQRGLEVAQRLRPEVDEARRDYFEKFLAVLTPQQKEDFAPLGEDFLQRRLPPLEAITWQLRNVDLLVVRNEGLRDERFAGVTMKTPFKIDSIGRLVHFNPTMSESSLRRLVNLAPLFHANGILTLLTGSWLSEELEVSETQQEAILDLADELSQFQDDAQQRRQGLSGAEYRAMVVQLDREAVVKSRDLLARLDEILLPHQVMLLERISEVAELVQAGAPYALLHGRLGRRLAIMPEQKRQIVEMTDDLATSIERRAREWERQITEELRGFLSTEQRRELDRLLGPEIEHVPANVDLMLEHLTHPFGRQR